jgi:PhnB protein
MSAKPIPEGFHTVTPYLTVDDPDDLMKFLQQAFGAEQIEVMRDGNGNIRHAEARIGDSILMMGKARDEWHPRPGNFYLYVPDCDAVYKKAIAAGGKAIQEPKDQVYGDRHGAVRDSQGNDWWIATRVEDVSPEEIERRMNAAAH